MRFICTALLALSLVACGKRQPLASSSSLTVVAGEQSLPSPQRSDLVAADRPSLVGPLDTINVDIFGLPELSRDVQVDASGRVAMPLIGTIDARGKTADELAATIESALRAKHIRDPNVTINIRNSVSQVVTIDGQVVQPGLYPVTNQMTLMRAIASAKGVSEFAKLDDVVVLRTVNNRKMAGLYNVRAIRSGVYDDPSIYANDVIIVGDSPSRRLFRDLISLSPLLSAPLIAVVR